MNLFKNIAQILISVSLLSSCMNDDFMDRYPLDKLTDKTTFTTDENFRTYMWKFYDNRSFLGYDHTIDLYDGETDNSTNQGSVNSTNRFAWDKVTIPTSGGGWDFGTIRSLNLMLDNIEGSKLTEDQKKHWRSVGYFFKALDYFYLLDRFGDVSWVEHYITDADVDELYKPRTPRKEVAKKILEILLYAKDNIKSDGPNTINKDCVLALISRFGLYEGTWQKYHNLSDEVEYKVYLQASYDASAELIQKHPNIITSYDAVFNSKDLAGKPGILLYRNYLNTSPYGHVLIRYTRAKATAWHGTADMLQSYLCTDGKPIWTSADYKGNQETGNDPMHIEFENRDRRLYYTFVPPYKANDKKGNPLKGRVFIQDYTRTSNPDDSKFIDLMDQIAKEDGSEKQLPLQQWEGVCVSESPHMDDTRYAMAQVFCVSRSGYYFWKYYNTSTDIAKGQGDTDAPIFRMGEVLVNHAEVAYELGLFDQNVADQTINKLRKRAHVADMNVAAIDGGFDPKRDADVSPVLWEIRRERRVELIAEGFRFKDICRWKKGEYLNKVPKGAFFKKTDLEDTRHQAKPDVSKFPFALDGGDEGRIIIYGTPANPALGAPNPGWQNKYYYMPLPIEDLILNSNLAQNPGYALSN